MPLTFLRNLGIVSAAGITTTKLGAGAVLQVVQASTTTSTIIASTSYVDTTLTASITPISASNKILVITSQTSLIVHSANTVIEGLCQLLRTSTSLLERNGEVNSPTGANGFTVGNLNVNFVYLDSPNTTSSTTYKTQGKVSTTSNSGQIRFQSGSQPSTITLMEIAG
jgi:hypothetical protein